MPNIGEAFPSNYLKASDLRGAEPVVTIDRVEFEPVGRQKEIKPIVYFIGKEKGIVLNKTNANKIVQLAGSSNTEDWHGFAIKLFATMVEFAGDQVEAIRVKAAPPQARQVPPPVVHADLDDTDIPFNILLPLLLPALGLMGALLS